MSRTANVTYHPPMDWSEFVEQSRKDARGFRHSQDDTSWTGGTPQMAQRILEAGDPGTMRRLERMIEETAAAVDLETDGLDIDHSVIGCAPDVAAELSFDPECMITLDDDPSQSAPVTIRVYAGGVASVAADDLLRRTAAAVTLARIVATTRPVRFEASIASRCGARGWHDVAVTVGDSPLDLARLSAICHPTFLRVTMLRHIARLSGYDHSGFTYPVLPESKGSVPHWPHEGTAMFIGVALANADLRKACDRPAEWIAERAAKIADACERGIDC